MPATLKQSLSGNGIASGGRSAASGVRLRVILPLAMALILLVGTFVVISLLEARQRASEDIGRTAASIDVMFREQSSEGIQVMQSIMELLVRDRHLEAAFRARDRQALLDLSTPILNGLRAKNHISHFYYILPDRTMLLRVQAPDKYGDKIERFVLQEAQRTGKPFWGNEQGPLGSYTLRAVYPWVSNGEVIGYLEMGVEFEDLMQEIKNSLDVDVFVAINKSFFNRAKWEEAQGKKQRPVAWDEFPAVVVLSRTTPTIPAPIATYLGTLKGLHSKRTFEIDWNGKVAQTVVVPFANLRGQELGELVVLRDITASASRGRESVIQVAILGTIVGGSLMLFFYILLGRVQRDVAQRTASLREAERMITAEQFERQRTEDELTAQQERNGFLEARGRMVEELAVAKDASEAALRENENVTRKLRLVQGELLAAAHAAGMAELATNVLHNVGNVLNSVNVSAGMVSTRLRASKLPGLAKATQLMSEHAGDLAHFLASDDRGSQLPGYLSQLAETLAAERLGIIEELGQLTKGIDHIREIVATQQSYAAEGAVIEVLPISDLVNDALRMNGDALARQRVTVVKEFAEMPPLPLDRHRVLLILINLISNAKHAMDALPDHEPRITLQVDIQADRTLRIRVADNGEGIAAENLTRIFAHGFTTRKEGHGFGLHSCANAATEMGGKLTAYSEGPGKGAAFVLEIPVYVSEVAA